MDLVLWVRFWRFFHSLSWGHSFSVCCLLAIRNTSSIYVDYSQKIILLKMLGNGLSGVDMWIKNSHSGERKIEYDILREAQLGKCCGLKVTFDGKVDNLTDLLPPNFSTSLQPFYCTTCLCWYYRKGGQQIIISYQIYLNIILRHYPQQMYLLCWHGTWLWKVWSLLFCGGHQL